MGFFSTKDRHKYKQASGPSSLTNKNTGGEGTWGHLRIYISPLLYSSVPEIFTENTIRKRPYLGNIPKVIQIVYMFSSK